ncbi:MAG: alpha/beta hydrolase [Sphingobacteriaceae bacterium]|nr:MAG: alpha/beta hydrolase [Sphingobacteriaceae bacterium]
MKLRISLLKGATALMTLLPFTTQAQELINLYPGAVPNSKVSKAIDQTTLPQNGQFSSVVKPQLEVYLPEKDKANGAAVILIPGGSYKVIVFAGEGRRSAAELVKQGLTVFILKYRLPNDSMMVDKTIGPLQDAQQAVKIVRENAAKYGVDANKVGVIGFSAGGHLASTIATHFQKAVIDNANATNLRPDFVGLVYPVISMQDNLTHKDSRKNLLGATPTKEQIDLYSNELQVDSKTPPTFLVHAGDDRVVLVDNSIAFYQHLIKAGVPAEMHLFPKGGHGFGGQPIDMWVGPLVKWMQNNKWINKQ